MLGFSARDDRQHTTSPAESSSGFPEISDEHQKEEGGIAPALFSVTGSDYKSSPSISVMPCSSSTCWAMRAYSSSKSSPPWNSLRLGSGYSPSSMSRLR